jgi:hypothetical protein
MLGVQRHIYFHVSAHIFTCRVRYPVTSEGSNPSLAGLVKSEYEGFVLMRVPPHFLIRSIQNELYLSVMYKKFAAGHKGDNAMPLSSKL